MSFGVMSHSALCRIRPYVVQDCVVRRNVAWPNVGVSAHLPPLTPSIWSSGLPMEPTPPPLHLLGPGSSPAIFEAVKVIVLALSTDKVAAAEMHQHVMGIRSSVFQPNRSFLWSKDQFDLFKRLTQANQSC